MTNLKKPNGVVLSLFVCNWIFGVGVIQYPLGIRRPTISFIYSSICISSFCLLSAVSCRQMDQWSLDTTISLLPSKITMFANIALIIIVVTLAWTRSEAIVDILIKSLMVNDMMRSLGIKLSLGRIHKAYAHRLIISAILVVFLIIANVILIFLMKRAPLDQKIASAITLFYSVSVMFIADMTFTISVSATSRKYKILNQTLRSMLTDEFEIPRHQQLINRSVGEESELPLNTIGNSVNNSLNMIKLTKKIHLKLVKVCEQINDTYEMQILLSIVVAFSVITENIYRSYMLLQDPLADKTLIFESSIDSFTWIVYYAFKISNISHTCSHCTKNAIETGDILNKFYDEPFANDEIQSEVKDFIIQVMQRPVKFTAAGFVTLDSSLIQIMISSITTYLMILIQLEESLT